MSVPEVYERTDGDDFSSSIVDQLDHVTDHLSGANDIVDEQTLQALSIQILPKIITSLVFLGPKNLIGIQRLAHPECYRYPARGRSYYRAIRQSCKNLRLAAQQTRQRHGQHARVAVIAHRKRHL